MSRELGGREETGRVIGGSRDMGCRRSVCTCAYRCNQIYLSCYGEEGVKIAGAVRIVA